ncbi:unnamed protein product [Protopolystoma xenopodis]|uniref:Uncharacterized protein n=1 Tax=Protopolystoma xenopodis TaxID=117903 RepID=A0A3S5BUE6_9PLAT|nr:unnamed protein product [Protopolystoma xenopodis]
MLASGSAPNLALYIRHFVSPPPISVHAMSPTCFSALFPLFNYYFAPLLVDSRIACLDLRLCAIHFYLHISPKCHVLVASTVAHNIRRNVKFENEMGETNPLLTDGIEIGHEMRGEVSRKARTPLVRSEVGN